MNNMNKGILRKIIKDYNSIRTNEDLMKRNLTLAEFNSLGFYISDMQRESKATFYQQGICDYLKSFGLNIIQKNGYYVVNLKGS